MAIEYDGELYYYEYDEIDDMFVHPYYYENEVDDTIYYDVINKETWIDMEDE